MTEANVLYTIGVDLGQVQDHSAMVITRVDKHTDTLRRFTVVGLKKRPLQTDYTVVAKQITQACHKLIEQGAKIESVTVDATGGGNAVADLLIRTLKEHKLGDISIEPFTFTSEKKRDLIGNLKILLQERRLKFADADTDPDYTRTKQELIDELTNYEVRIQDEGPERYGVFKTGKHCWLSRIAMSGHHIAPSFCL